MINKLYPFVKKTDGQSLVEFALVLPVFIVILFGIIEYGRLWETANILTSAAREGVRVAAVTAPDAARVQSAAQNILNAGGIIGATISISGPNSANEVTVTITFNYTPITGTIVPGVGGLSLVRQSTMRWEG